MKKKHWTLSPWFIIFAAAMMFMATASYSYNIILCYIELGISVAAFAVVFVMSFKFNNYIRSIVKSAAGKISGVESDYLEEYKFPVAVAGEKGDIIWCNSRFRKNMCSGKSPEGENISAYLSDRNINDVKDGEGIDVAVNGREYTAFFQSVDGGAVCQFIENTFYKETAREYQASRPCVAIITFDNADDFANESDEVYSEIVISVRSCLQKWAAEYDALYKKISDNRYMIIFRESDVEKLVEAKFPVLRQIHSIKYNQHEATISAGLCRGAKTIKDSEANARKALEMALGRGGDQIAVIRDNSYEFFGGTAVAAEKVSKVRMRVIANAVSRAVADCDKVYIMGHRFSDLDCVGASIGMQCIMERSFNRYSKIVIDKSTSMAQSMIEYAEEKLSSDIFIMPDEALRGITPKSLLIIVDTHIKTSLESMGLFEKSKKVIVVDHHRKAVNFIDNALVFCHEPSASSASEMCSEIISYLDDKPLGYVQANALLSGIMLDTKNFVIKTGVRTFEAAAYLKKKGANTVTVKEMFADSIDTYREKVDIVCNAHIYKGCAVSVAQKDADDVRLASAQAADEMLTIQGVNASFVIYKDSHRINISARSYGKINVQIIMEKLGGGGHQTMAAAQLGNISKELAYQQLLAVIDEVLDDVSHE
ncbi:MAG: DHH family phosphoesterase [Clostridiales bacterium]|nr:DHH family phosphoesterase [Clostridiales bacterium]